MARRTPVLKPRQATQRDLQFRESTAPSAEEQLLFLDKLQRILAEGQVQSTYKYALLHALSDLCQTSDDSGLQELVLPTRNIAARMIELYWGQAAEFVMPGGETRTLVQDKGGQRIVLEKIRVHLNKTGRSPSSSVTQKEVRENLASEFDHKLRAMPLPRLQNVPNGPDPFLYRIEGRVIILRPGVGYCFRRFHGLVLQLVESAWLRFVRRCNRLEGAGADLEAFLFGMNRISLEPLRESLRDLQAARCFFCAKSLGPSTHIDHFVPWSHHQANLGHNLVLADDRCNLGKSDQVPSERLLSLWVRRNVDSGIYLDEECERLGQVHDIRAAGAVARAYYEQADMAGLSTWDPKVAPSILGGAWRALLAEHP